MQGRQEAGSSFEQGQLPDLLYICPLRLDEEGQPPHSHTDHAELLLIRDGSAVVYIDGQEEPLQTGDFVLCDAGKLHSYYTAQGTSAQAVSCGFVSLHCRGMDENCFIGTQEHPIVRAGQASRALDYILAGLEKATDSLDAKNEEARRYMAGAAVVLALQLHRIASERAEHAHFDLGVRTRIYLDRHYLEPLTLDGIAEAMGVSKYHLDRVFLKTMDCTPIQYVIRRRMARAQTLLASTRDTIQHIAAQCGYDNYNYFTVLFRKTTGKTPREYRNIMQGRG